MRLSAAETSFLAIGGLVAMIAIGFAAWSHAFGLATALADEPIALFTALYALSGLAIAGLAWPLASAATWPNRRQILGPLIAIGLVLRVAMLWSEPVLETDYRRYLWDGAVLAHGLDPYQRAPEAAAAQPADTAIGALARDGAATIAEINFPQLRTLYPPVAELAFAVAHWLSPFSLTSWRAIILVCECTTLALLLSLLGMAGRPPAWAALYWWNPLVVKELMNSGHMEALLLPPLLGTLWLALRQRPRAAALALAVAAGVKLWPVLLFPLLWRKAGAAGMAVAAVFATAIGAWAIPFLWFASGDDSGLTAYAQDWQTFGALLPLLEVPLDAVSAAWTGDLAHGDMLARGLVALLAIVAAVVAPLWPRWRGDAADLIARAGTLAVIIFLLSPAQFPWYAVWWLPFLPFLPWRPLLALNVTLPLYYLAFHLMARDQRDLLEGVVIWAAWVPVWLLFAYALRQHFLVPTPGHR